MGRLRRAVKPVALSGVVAFGLLQLVPYGWRHPNPPVTATVPWPSPESERLARAACYDCHSNETEWPPYSYVAPMSWLVRNDVERGRDELNFSTGGADDASDAAEAVEDGSMPPDRYVRLHPDADLSAAERQALIQALEAMDEQAEAAEEQAEEAEQTEEEAQEEAEDDAEDEADDGGGGNSGPGGGGNSGPGSGD